MCGRYVIAALPEELFARLRVAMPGNFHPRFNVAPTQDAPILRVTGDGSLAIRHHRWGLVPFWSAEPSIGNRLINARSESAAEKPAFKEAFTHRRCVVPTTGFYEWKKIGSAKQPFLVSRNDGQPFVYAGLWEKWTGASKSPGESPLYTFTILTCTPSASIAGLHDRMPVILDEKAVRIWLDPDQRDVDTLASILRPPADDVLKMHPVSRRVNSPQNDDPSLVDPIDPADLPASSKSTDEPTLFG